MAIALRERENGALSASGALWGRIRDGWVPRGCPEPAAPLGPAGGAPTALTRSAEQVILVASMIAADHYS